ncbi:hypothetical protein M407DRAFT_11193 [Tulasnella calospora MUT 4182]|uniref:Uncharacterized protein n=1 Tax=Tulasnella calospora MUT 4182 TaxID=1051891 RepID=A0A0C3KEI8_9AGAM|nr:hypothetical protein M407DRAFT_11193 [Tulasnella calospora MUT 4182]
MNGSGRVAVVREVGQKTGVGGCPRFGMNERERVAVSRREGISGIGIVVGTYDGPSAMMNEMTNRGRLCPLIATFTCNYATDSPSSPTFSTSRACASSARGGETNLWKPLPEEYADARLYSHRLINRYDGGQSSLPPIEPFLLLELSDSNSLNGRIDALIKRTEDLVPQNEKIVSQNEKLMTQSTELSKKLDQAIEKSQAVEDSLEELKGSFSDVRIRFSQWSIPQSRLHSQMAVSRRWSKESPSEHPALLSVEQILDLDYNTARRLATKYKIATS